MSIYMIHLFDYDGECTRGYFATKEAAEHARLKAKYEGQ